MAFGVRTDRVLADVARVNAHEELDPHAAELQEPAAQPFGDGDDEFFRAHLTTATRLAYLVVRDRALAEELAHDALLKCASRRSLVRDDARFRRYLNRAIVRLAIDRERSTQRRIRREATYHTGTTLPADDIEADVANRVDILSALGRIDTTKRCVLVLKYWLDYSDAQIAAAMGCRIGTVKSRLARGLEQLRGELNA